MAARLESGRAFFSESQHALMSEVLDRLVPPNGELPGAEALGVADFVDRTVSESAQLRELFLAGLASVEAASQVMFSSGFSVLLSEKKIEVLRRVEVEQPRFFEALVRQTYLGYYTSPRIKRLLGMDPRPPQPAGYPVGPFEADLLEKVRKRGKVWRDAGA